MPASPGPKEIARQWFEEVWIKGDPSAIHRLMAPEAKAHMERDATLVGPDAFMPVFLTLTGTFPELSVVIEDIVGDDNHACVRWSAKGKHAGPGMGLPPTGKEVRFRGITWMTVKDGQIVEGWDSWNQGGLLTELGLG